MDASQQNEGACDHEERRQQTAGHAEHLRPHQPVRNVQSELLKKLLSVRGPTPSNAGCEMDNSQPS